MRRAISIALFACILMYFSSCAKEYISNKNEILMDYSKNQTLFERCTGILLEKYSHMDQVRYSIKIDSDMLVIRSMKTVDDTWHEWMDLSNRDLAEIKRLFQNTNIKYVLLSGDSILFIEYSTGMGSTTYAGICYIPSRSIETLSEYNPKMRFREYDGGSLGELEYRDNYLFYQEITPYYYFFEYGD